MRDPSVRKTVSGVHYATELTVQYSFGGFFFFNDTATTEIYTLSYTTLFRSRGQPAQPGRRGQGRDPGQRAKPAVRGLRSEEHTSELQSRRDLVCRLLLEKKKKNKRTPYLRTQITTHPNL